MGKQKREIEYDCVARGMVRYLHIPARKARLLTNMIKGMTVREALNTLAVTPRPSAVPAIKRLLLSVVASVDRKAHPNTDDLIVSKIYADGGPMLKRTQAHAMGRAFRIRRRSCHVTLELGE